MATKFICPPDCPGRYPGCGAKCEKFLKHREECAERYKKNLAQNEIMSALHDGWKRVARK